MDEELKKEFNNIDFKIKALADGLEKRITNIMSNSAQEAAKLTADAILGSVKVETDALLETIKTTTLIKNDIEYIKTDVEDINAKLDSHYVTKAEFDPVRNIVYGMVGVILLAVIGALVALVIAK